MFRYWNVFWTNEAVVKQYFTNDTVHGEKIEYTKNYEIIQPISFAIPVYDCVNCEILSDTVHTANFGPDNEPYIWSVLHCRLRITEAMELSVLFVLNYIFSFYLYQKFSPFFIINLGCSPQKIKCLLFFLIF